MDIDQQFRRGDGVAKARLRQIAGLAAAVGVCASGASGDVITFEAFEYSQGAAVSGLDLRADLMASGSTVDVTFRNQSFAPSVITSIYIENSPLLAGLLQQGAIAGSSPGVSFGPGAAPPNPPGSIGSWQGNLLALQAVAPTPHNGIGPGESLTVQFQLGGSYQSLMQGLTSTPPDFRIVQHVQGLSGGGSAWVQNTAPPKIPAPGGGILLVACAGLVAWRRRR